MTGKLFRERLEYGERALERYTTLVSNTVKLYEKFGEFVKREELGGRK